MDSDDENGKIISDFVESSCTAARISHENVLQIVLPLPRLPCLVAEDAIGTLSQVFRHILMKIDDFFALAVDVAAGLHALAVNHVRHEVVSADAVLVVREGGFHRFRLDPISLQVQSGESAPTEESVRAYGQFLCTIAAKAFSLGCPGSNDDRLRRAIIDTVLAYVWCETRHPELAVVIARCCHVRPSAPLPSFDGIVRRLRLPAASRTPIAASYRRNDPWGCRIPDSQVVTEPAVIGKGSFSTVLRGHWGGYPVCVKVSALNVVLVNGSQLCCSFLCRVVVVNRCYRTL
jgi:hypothetical protein